MWCCSAKCGCRWRKMILDQFEDQLEPLSRPPGRVLACAQVSNQLQYLHQLPTFGSSIYLAQNLTAPSMPVETTEVPAGEKQTPVTSIEWALRVTKGVHPWTT